MARKRMIDPSFWIDEKLGTCDPLARLTFMGLISQSDDDGRLNGHPSLIKSVLFPYDYGITTEQIQEWLQQLEERSLIIQYQVNNQSYICIPNFSKHQTINKRTPSKLPAPPINEYYGSTTVVVDEQEGSGVVQKKRSEVNRKEVTRSEDSPVTGQSLIAELVSKYRESDKVAETHGDYPFIGSLYNEFGYDRVLEAIHLLHEKILFDPIDKPLMYMKGIIKKTKSEYKPKPQKVDEYQEDRNVVSQVNGGLFN